MKLNRFLIPLITLGLLLHLFSRVRAESSNKFCRVESDNAIKLNPDFFG
jgi:hypothetical protein